MFPLVSVIMPAYNAERFIRRSLQSLLRQTYQNMEIVVVNDGSTDHTADIVRVFSDPHTRHIYQDNRGLGGARNRGILESRGEYVTFLDADDMYLAKNVELQVEFLESHAEYDAIFCNPLAYYSEAPDRLLRLRQDYVSYSSDMFRYFLEFSVNPNTLMYRRSVFDAGLRFPDGTRGRYGEDRPLYLRMCKAGFKFGHFNKDLVIVGINTGGVGTWENQWNLYINKIKLLEEVFSDMTDAEAALYQKDKIMLQQSLKLALSCLIKRDKQAFYALLPQTSLKPFTWLLKGVLFFMPSHILRNIIITTGEIRRKHFYSLCSEKDHPSLYEEFRALRGLAR